jgi:putative SOS response-associated peptidase YedK
MCGRFTLTLDIVQVQDHFGLNASPSVAFRPTYNAAPSQRLPVIINQQRDTLQFFRWGLIPHWAKDESIGNKMINARAETLAEKPSFKKLIERKRCLVVADGFYEWKKLERKKQPYRMTLRSGGPFAFAGLWENWADRETGELQQSFSIITTDANELVREVHDRMPVILPREAEAQWLTDGQPQSHYLSLLKPYPAEQMDKYPVGELVNSPANNSPELLERLNSQ